jgi:uncharacterized protein YwgA
MDEKNIELTKINIQKLVYFLRETNIPVTYKFAPYIYGPYSSELKSDIEDLLMWENITLQGNKYKVQNIPKDDSSFYSKISEKIESFKTALNNDFSFDNMEISGTLIYCYKALKKAQEKPNEGNVLKEFKNWKGNKYTDAKINQIFSKIKPLIEKY